MSGIAIISEHENLLFFVSGEEEVLNSQSSSLYLLSAEIIDMFQFHNFY